MQQLTTTTSSQESAVVLDFPSPPIAGNAQLVPICSWYEMYLETLVTGVEFDNFWFESVIEGVTYFFSWHEHPRSTILAVFLDIGECKELTYIECRTLGDVLVEGEDLEKMQSTLVHAFLLEGYAINLAPVECSQDNNSLENPLKGCLR